MQNCDRFDDDGTVCVNELRSLTLRIDRGIWAGAPIHVGGADCLRCQRRAETASKATLDKLQSRTITIVSI